VGKIRDAPPDLAVAEPPVPVDERLLVREPRGACEACGESESPPYPPSPRRRPRGLALFDKPGDAGDRLELSGQLLVGDRDCELPLDREATTSRMPGDKRIPWPSKGSLSPMARFRANGNWFQIKSRIRVRVDSLSIIGSRDAQLSRSPWRKGQSSRSRSSAGPRPGRR
jgi:hypothetical protein